MTREDYIWNLKDAAVIIDEFAKYGKDIQAEIDQLKDFDPEFAGMIQYVTDYGLKIANCAKAKLAEINKEGN